MTSEQLTDPRIETYLDRLRTGLDRVAPDDREDILREIRTHILDSSASGSDQTASIDRVLRLLGTPEELAGRYGSERQLAHASRSFSPWILLRACWRWARIGMKGTFAFLLALMGYSVALACTAAVFLKPLMPSRIGMWIGSESLNIGVPSHPEQMKELLGSYFVPVIAAAAFAAAVGTTFALRWIMRQTTRSSALEVSRT